MRGFSAIGLINTKTEANVGGVLRAASCYGAAMVAIQGKRYKKAVTDTLKTYRHIPLLHMNDLKEAIPFDCIPIGVELTSDAVDICTFQHPERAFYIFGPEDGNIPKEVLAWCQKVVKIPTKHCMNLAATVNVVLYDRIAKG